MKTDQGLVFSAETKEKAVAFIFSRVKKKAISKAELFAVSRTALQLRYIRLWADREKRDLVTIEIATTTNGQKAFADDPLFHKAIALAIEHKCDLVLANVKDLFSRTAANKIGRCALALDNAPVEIWDASKNIRWSSLTHDQKQWIINFAAFVQLNASQSVKNGLKLRSKPGSSHPENAKRGNLANKHKADAAAGKLAQFVQSERSKLAAGVPLSPAALARSLNDAGVRPERVAAWSYNSAKNLMARIDAARCAVGAV